MTFIHARTAQLSHCLPHLPDVAPCSGRPRPRVAQVARRRFVAVPHPEGAAERLCAALAALILRSFEEDVGLRARHVEVRPVDPQLDDLQARGLPASSSSSPPWRSFTSIIWSAIAAAMSADVRSVFVGVSPIRVITSPMWRRATLDSRRCRSAAPRGSARGRRRGVLAALASLWRSPSFDALGWTRTEVAPLAPMYTVCVARRVSSSRLLLLGLEGDLDRRLLRVVAEHHAERHRRLFAVDWVGARRHLRHSRASIAPRSAVGTMRTRRSSHRASAGVSRRYQCSVSPPSGTRYSKRRHLPSAPREDGARGS